MDREKRRQTGILHVNSLFHRTPDNKQKMFIVSYVQPCSPAYGMPSGHNNSEAEKMQGY